MILRCCLHCEFHVVREEEGRKMGHCSKENLWTWYTKCVTRAALDRFLDQERVGAPLRFSVIEHVYRTDG